MFSPKDEVEWWCDKLKFIRAWIKCSGGYNYKTQAVAMQNYANVLVSVFTVLFIQRLKQKGKCI